MDKTHAWPFAAGFNARCEARTAAANAIVVGEYPIVSTSRSAPVTPAQATYVKGPAADDSALTWPTPCK